MSVIDLLSELRARNVKLWLDQGELCYSAPDGGLTPALQAALTARTAEIVVFLRKAMLTQADRTPPLVPLPREGLLPLSLAQEHLWCQAPGGTDPASFNLPLVVRVRGALELGALEQSLTRIITRHEILRTTLAMESPAESASDAPLGQRIAVAAPAVKVRLVDRQPMDAAAIQGWIVTEAQQPFDLQTGPLVRAALLPVADREHVLLLTVHRLVADERSLELLLHELALIYPAVRAGCAAPLAPLTVQYADFAVWQRTLLHSNSLKRQLAFWRHQLADPPPPLRLFADLPPPIAPSGRAARQSFTIPPAFSDALATLSRQHDATLFMTLLAALQILLSRLTEQSDLLVGTPTTSRNRPELEPLIGCFTNMVLLRSQLADNPRFIDFLARVRDTTHQALTHQDLPFETLATAIQPTQAPAQRSLVQALFAFEAPAPSSLASGELEWTRLPSPSLVASCDLMVTFREHDGALTGTLEYRAEHYSATQMARLAAHYHTLLDSIVTDPDQPIRKLPLLRPDERQQLIAAGRATFSDDAQRATLLALVAAQALRTPEAIAVRAEDGALSYAALLARANQLAHQLQTCGVTPETRVGVLLDRSSALVVALLAVLTAGGAYLPLDLADPPARLAFMLNDAQAALVLTEQRQAALLAEWSGPLLCLDTDEPQIATQPTSAPQSDLRPDNLAYIIYTSGSTGQPKGVMVNHANVTRLLTTTQSWFRFGPQDVWTLFHATTFDFSVWELWGALCTGGRLVVVPYLMSRDPAALGDLLRAEGITVLNQTPSAFRQLMQAEIARTDGDKLALRLIIFGGEALDFTSLQPWFARFGDTQPQLVNMYGITETTVHVTYRPLTATDAVQASGSLIGRAIPDLELFILNEQLEPVPIGMAGELYVGGAGVARGYLNRPALTAERFIPNPFAQAAPAAPGARLYRTGDLARRHSLDEIEYLGRSDQQVKLRGFRIETREIEAALRLHPAVRDAVVLVREDPSPAGGHLDQRLVAYVVGQGTESRAPSTEHRAPTNQGTGQHVASLQSLAASPQPLLPADLRDFLQRTLPSYMLPAAFVPLTALPLTASGKLDRRALPAPESQHVRSAATWVAPRTPLEQALVEIWGEVLGGVQIGIYDNFFDLGGHSLLATQISARVQARFQVTPALRTFFEQPTIARLAEAIEQSQAQVAAAAPSSIQALPRRGRSTRQSGAATSSSQSVSPGTPPEEIIHE